MTGFEVVKIDEVSVEWDCWFEAGGEFRGWVPRESSPLGERFSLIYLRTPRNRPGPPNGWYLEGPDRVRDFLDPQPPPFAATLEAATRRALEIVRTAVASHVVTISSTIYDDGLDLACSCGEFLRTVVFGIPIDDLAEIQAAHRAEVSQRPPMTTS